MRKTSWRRNRLATVDWVMWTLTFIIAFLVVLALLAVSMSTVFAIDDPDSITIVTVRAYSGVLQQDPDDLLVVVSYDIEYPSTPTETASDTFFGRFLVEGSEVKSVSPIAFNDRGFGKGIFSLYWTASEKTTDSIEFESTTEVYTIILQGKPSIFPDPPKRESTGITWRDAAATQTLLTTDVTDLAQTLENDAAWAANNFTLLGRLPGRVALSSDGQDYFGRAIPNLASMVPSLFTTSVTSLDFEERDHQRSQEEELETFWDGTPVATALASLSDDFSTSENVIKFFVAFIIMCVVAAVAGIKGGNAEWGLITMPFMMVVFIPMNMVTLTVGMLVAFIALFVLGFKLILNRVS